MKDILTAPFVREMCDTTANMYRLGWDERNFEIVFRVFLHIFEILACARNDKNLADKLGCIKACGNCSDYIVKVEILRNLVFIKQITDVSAVSLG